MKRIVFLCGLVALFSTACSDDPEPATAPNPEPDNMPEPDPQPDMNPAPNPDPNPTPEPAPNNDQPPCAEGALFFLAPAGGEDLAIGDDSDPVEPGVQITAMLATTLSVDTLVTVENLSNGTSVGALISGGETTVSGITLANGDNVLRAIALTDDCLARSPEITVNLQGPMACGVDGDCPDGQLCIEEGLCEACDAQCASEADCGGRACIQGCFCEPGAHRFVMIEDLTNPVAGDSPGADLDAVSIIKGGDEFFAQSVEDASVDTPGNLFDDPSDILGAPDAGCQVQNFVSLGGSANGGYIIVSMGDGQRDVSIDNGDSVKVYEIGAFLCNRFDDDPYQVSVSVSTDLGSFVEIGEGGAGGNVIPVTGL